jgi:hypothetical protein
MLTGTTLDHSLVTRPSVAASPPHYRTGVSQPK